MDTKVYEYSEFSVHEILYMGHEDLTFIVDNMIAGSSRDPFDIVAEIEEDLGRALAFNKGEFKM